jgi:anthranilate phosphoribosyltransferase
MALMLVGKVDNLRSGVHLAAEAIDQGRAATTLQQLGSE